MGQQNVDLIVNITPTTCQQCISIVPLGPVASRSHPGHLEIRLTHPQGKTLAPNDQLLSESSISRARYDKQDNRKRRKMSLAPNCHLDSGTRVSQ